MIAALWRYLASKATHRITTDSFRADIESLGLGWKAQFDPTVDARILKATDTYLESLPPRIEGSEIEIEEVARLIEWALRPTAKITLVTGGAGGGKSVAMARMAAAARERGWPVLALRVDHHLAAATLEQIGQETIGLAENPMGVLGNRFGDQDTLLLIDQVDAVSEASGRSGRIRNLLFQMLHDKRHFSKMRVVAACRAYDFENDTRLKALVESGSAKSFYLGAFDWESAVRPVLDRLGAGQRTFTEQERRILSVPINLQLFANIARTGEAPPAEISGGRLFDALLAAKAREFHRAGHGWTPQDALGAMSRWMSENQELTAPIGVLASFPNAVEALSSSGLISATTRKVQFAHESFFDHIFSSSLVASGQDVLTLLLSDEQRLFRRTQVRQIFSRLREEAAGRKYLSNLASVLNSPDVRYLVKDAVATWLAGVSDPSDGEFAAIAAWYAPDHPLERLARTVLAGSAWGAFFIRTGRIASLFDSGDEKRSLAFWVMWKGATQYSGLIAEFLRNWWGGDDNRAVELLQWFGRFRPQGGIGELEELYLDLIANCPSAYLNPDDFEAAFDLGSWVDKEISCGARVLGAWIKRWMREFPKEQPFTENRGGQNGFWFKELAKQQPKAFLEAVLDSFAEALRRDAAALENGVIYWPKLVVPTGPYDGFWTAVMADAVAEVAKSEPEALEALIGLLSPHGVVATYLNLTAIAANGTALGRRLLPLMAVADVFEVGPNQCEWEPFAKAAREAMPGLSAVERLQLEEAILAYRPELDYLRSLVRRRRDEGEAFTGDLSQRLRWELPEVGKVEWAILSTIGVDRLSEVAQRRFEELRRKFVGRSLPEPGGPRGGVVRSPIKGDAVSRMTDTQWLTAMRRYSGNDEHRYERNFVIGGARELAGQLQGRTKEAPRRFATLLTSFPSTTNPAYVEAVLSGLREAEEGAKYAASAIAESARWPEANFDRAICWLVERHPVVAADRRVLERVLRVAETGNASDTVVRTTRKSGDAPTGIQDLLFSRSDLSSSGINGERGAAFNALANVLWNDVATLADIANLVERRIEEETLTSVRTCMLYTINSIANHDLARGLALLRRLARKDISCLQSTAGRELLDWAGICHPTELDGVVQSLVQSNETNLRVEGLFLEAGAALSDEALEPGFVAGFVSDPLRRQVAAFRAAGNIRSGAIGDRASRWLRILCDDPEQSVRDELAHIDWDAVLDPELNRSDVAETYVNSASFDAHSDRIIMALEERLDFYPDLTFSAMRRLLGLFKTQKADGQAIQLVSTHKLGRILVALYRAVQGDTAGERELLDLFDVYLELDIWDLRSEIAAYERH